METMLRIVVLICVTSGAMFLVRSTSHGAVTAARRRWRERRAAAIEACTAAGVPAHFLAVIGAVLLGGVGMRSLAFMRRRRCHRAERQLPELLTLIGNGLRAGLALQQTIACAAEHVSAPLGDEMRHLVGELRLGRSLEEAFEGLRTRLSGEEIDLFVWTVIALRRSGGNLIEAFETLRTTIEGRRRVADRIHLLTSQGVFQGAILLLLPWALGAGLFVVSPEFVMPLVETPLGNGLLVGAFLLELLGAWWLRHIVVIRV